MQSEGPDVFDPHDPQVPSKFSTGKELYLLVAFFVAPKYRVLFSNVVVPC